eukprot:65427-Chlamydomonas_euryale.AAC.2
MQGNIASSIKSNGWKALDPSTAIAMARLENPCGWQGSNLQRSTGYPEQAPGAFPPGWAISPLTALPEPLPEPLPVGPYHPQRDGIEAPPHALPLCSALDFLKLCLKRAATQLLPRGQAHA